MMLFKAKDTLTLLASSAMPAIDFACSPYDVLAMKLLSKYSGTS
jgi:hypothetical protein